MKFITGLVLLLSSSIAIAYQPSALYYQLGKVTVVPMTEAVDSSEIPVMDQCKPEGTTNRKDVGDEIDGIGVIVDKIVNVGKKVWAIVELGRPVFNVKTDVAHALPAGVNCWSDLENWRAPQSKSWKVVYENQLGGKVVEFVYRVSYIYGGQYKGVGQYVTQATISVSKLYVGWGYTFNVEGSVPSVFNMGTKRDPIAGMQMNVKWSVDTVMNHHQRDEQFHINGTGELQKMQVVEINH